MDAQIVGSVSEAKSQPPLVPGLPLFGSALKLRFDPLAYFLELHKQYGDIFQVKLLNRPVTVLVGLEANQLLAQRSDQLFGSKQLFGDFGNQMQTEIFLVAMDGEPHHHLRKLMKQGYSRSQAAAHLPFMLDVVNQFVDTLKPGQTFAVFPTLQRIVTEQLGMIMANRAPGDYFGDLQRFLTYMLNVCVLRMWPRIMLQHPTYRRSLARITQLGAEVVNDHRANPPVNRPRDLIDDLVAARDENGQPYSQESLIAATVGPYLAGIDTVASSLSFMVYTMLKYPAVTEAVTREAHEMLDLKSPSFDAFRHMEAMHNTAMETLRMYPVAPFTPRTVLESFEFGGYHIPAGTEVFFAQTATHYMPEFYPDPYRFDISRYETGGRGKPNTFAAYTLGPHLCLGAGLAEVQMMVIAAAFLKRMRLELETQDYNVKIHATPLPNPGRDFRVRVAEIY